MPELKKLDTIAEEWEQFERVVFPIGLPPSLKLLVRMAFYGGAKCAFTLLIQKGAGDETEEQLFDRLKAFQNELQEFAAGLSLMDAVVMSVLAMAMKREDSPADAPDKKVD